MTRHAVGIQGEIAPTDFVANHGRPWTPGDYDYEFSDGYVDQQDVSGHPWKRAGGPAGLELSS